MANLLRLVVATVCVALVVVCTGHAGDNEPEKPKADKPAESKPAPDSTVKKSSDPKDLAKANNAFGFKLLKELHADGDNTLISPVSLATALQMLAEGAKGDTKTELETVLGTDDIDTGKAFQAMYKLLPRNVQPDTGESEQDKAATPTNFRLANALFFDSKRVKLNKTTADELAKRFHADIRNLDFGSAKTPKTINDWVAKATENKIDSVVDSIHPNALLMLLNAVHFSGCWIDELDSDETKEAEFTLASGKTKSVQMMKHVDEMAYYQHDGHQGVELYLWGDCELIVLLPDEEKSVSGLLAHLHEFGLAHLDESLSYRKGTLKLPRFEVASDIDITNALREIGLRTTLSDDADWSNLVGDADVEGGATRAHHKATMSVDEKGCEASAATVIVEFRRSAKLNPPPPFNIVCDRPFMVVLRHRKTKSILFAGIVSDPGDK